MEEVLLGGEGSSGNGGRFSGGRRDIKSVVFRRRSDAIAFGSAYQKAAALVDLAEDGIGLPEQILDQADYETSAKFYFFFIRFDFLWTINYFALLALNFFEKPLWCLGNTEYSCSEREYYYLGQLPYLTSAESLIFEGVTLIVLLMHNLFPISYEGLSIYWKNPINKLKVTLLMLLVVDLCIYVLYLSPLEFSLPFRIAPYIRVVFFILIIPDLRESIVILAGMLGTYFNVLALSFLFLLFSSWVAFVMFEDTEQGKTIFTSFGTTVYQMFVLFTTSNNPDVWIPAYKDSRWYSLFFILYVLLGVYFVTNLILAVVYDSFKDQLAKIVIGKDRMRTRILMKAFNLVDKYNLGYLKKEQCIKLFEELNKYRTLPNISLTDYESIFDALDDSRDFKINPDEFADLCNAIALQFPKEESLPIFEYFPNVYNSTPSQSLKTFVRSPNFGYVVAFVLVLNLVAVVIETTLDVQNSSGQKVWQRVEFVFGWLYVVEMLLKIYAYGFVNYWRDGQNRFDCIITLVIVIGETATFLSPDDNDFLSNGEWIRYLLLARVLRLIRILMHVQQYRAFVATFLTLIPSLMPYLGTIFCIMCMYCSLGIQLFGGLVNAGNLKLESTELAENDYLLFNFNDYPNGMVTLFNLLVMGNWQSWMQSYKELTGTIWTYAYFVSFYLVTILLLLNLVIAFVLEAFFAEMEMEADGKGEDKKGQKDRRRSIGRKTRSQRVDALLHHMLGTELEQTESADP